MIQLVFGIYGGSKTLSSHHHTLRELTLSWSRYGYQGDIIEADTLDNLLNKVSESEYQLCFIQKAGHIIDEQWVPPCWNQERFYDHLYRFDMNIDFLVIGELENHNSVKQRLKDDCLLVNLHHYKKLNRPKSETFIQVSKDHSLPVRSFGEVMNRGRFYLASDNKPIFEQQLRKDPKLITGRSEMTEIQTSFLKGISSQTNNAQNGVFLFNIESYKDLENNSGIIDAIFSVAAGFKTNRILEVNGFTKDTNVIYYDYSKSALHIKKQIVENWNGEDFPSFVRHIFKTNPTPETFYQLWSGVTPENIDWKDVQWFWEYELTKWGSAAVFKKHWLQYQKLPHTYIHCNLLTDQQKLFTELQHYKTPFLWWSNAFFTVHSNWFYSYQERKNLYENWIKSLEFHSPNCRINGADYNNSSVNGFTAQEYLEQYSNITTNDLQPIKLNKTAISY